MLIKLDCDKLCLWILFVVPSILSNNIFIDVQYTNWNMPKLFYSYSDFEHGLCAADLYEDTQAVKLLDSCYIAIR